MKLARVAAAALAVLILLMQRVWAVDVSATAAVLMDCGNGQILYEKNADKRMLIASTTKILTALVVLENCGMQQEVTVLPGHMAEGSSMYLKPGEKMTVESLLYGLMLCSGNDAALVLAEACGGQQRFVRLMNDLAAEIGMDSSHFENPNGLDGKEHALFHSPGYGEAGGVCIRAACIYAHLLYKHCPNSRAQHEKPQSAAPGAGGVHGHEDRLYQGSRAYIGIMRGKEWADTGGSDVAGRQRLGRPRGSV